MGANKPIIRCGYIKGCRATPDRPALKTKLSLFNEIKVPLRFLLHLLVSPDAVAALAAPQFRLGLNL
jgi:hypothetical protein